MENGGREAKLPSCDWSRGVGDWSFGISFGDFRAKMKGQEKKKGN